MYSGGPGPVVLHEVYMNITSEQDIRAIYGSSYASNIMIGAAHAGDGKDTCQGDSGGPLSVEYNSTTGFKRMKQVGITSWGYGCGNVGLYARVSAYNNWIRDKISSFKRSIGVDN